MLYCSLQACMDKILILNTMSWSESAWLILAVQIKSLLESRFLSLLLLVTAATGSLLSQHKSRCLQLKTILFSLSFLSSQHCCNFWPSIDQDEWFNQALQGNNAFLLPNHCSSWRLKKVPMTQSNNPPKTNLTKFNAPILSLFVRTAVSHFKHYCFLHEDF